MIEFAENDYNMEAIKQDVDLSSFKARKSFRIFGLSQEENPPLGIRYNMDKFKSTEIQDELQGFFKNSGLNVDFEHHNEDGFSIGIRRDIRENIGLTSALIKTIIYHLEGRLELDYEFKINGLNKFVSTDSQ